VWLESRAGPGLRQLAGGGGVKLAINGLDAARLERTAEELRAATGTEITAVAADVTTAEGQKKLVAGLDLSSGARAGLTALLAGVARQVAHADVTINNLLPGFFDTDRCRACNEATAKLQGKTVETFAEARAATVPGGRIGDPVEFGHTCAFLCSAHAGYITGQNLLLDGGLHNAAF
jgi:enoyl-[acyl-carrier-protein] reductase (NADH)